MDIGEYYIQVSAELVDYPAVQSRFQIFLLLVQPCQVTQLVGQVTKVPISYSVDTSAVTGGHYIFTQTNACGYPVSIEIGDMPAFVTHDVENQRFSVEEDDKAMVGEYQVTFTGKVEVPNDYTFSATSLVSTDLISFTVVLQDECGSTELDDFTFGDQTITVLSDANTIALPVVLDSVSKAFGNQDGHSFCGARNYEIVGGDQYASFMTLDDDNDTILLQTSQVEDEGQYTVQLRVRLESMAASDPDTFKEASFTVTVNPCQVTDFGLAVDSAVGFSVGDETPTLLPYQLQQVTNCGYQVTTSLSNSHSFMTLNQDASQIEFFTSSMDDINTYTVTISSTIQVPTDYTRAEFVDMTAEQSIQVEILDPCSQTVFNSFSITDMQITINDLTNGQQTQQLPEVQDSVSLSVGNQDGLTACGAR